MSVAAMEGMECEGWDGLCPDLVCLPALSRESSRVVVPMCAGSFDLSIGHPAPFYAPAEFAAAAGEGDGDKAALPSADAATHPTHLLVDHVSQTDVSQASSRVATPSPSPSPLAALISSDERRALLAQGAGRVGGGERGTFGVSAFPNPKDAFRREPLLPLAPGAVDAVDVDGALGSASRKRKGGGYDLNAVSRMSAAACNPKESAQREAFASCRGAPACTDSRLFQVDEKTRRRLVKNRQSAEKSRQMRKVRMAYLEEKTSELSRALAAATARSELLEHILKVNGLSDMVPTQ
jgi:hypothetical protein